LFTESYKVLLELYQWKMEEDVLRWKKKMAAGGEIDRSPTQEG
jgi:hypothetical protein